MRCAGMRAPSRAPAGLDGGLQAAQAGFVLVAAVVANVELPGRHDVAAVDGHRLLRRVGEQPAHRADGAQVDLVDEGCEVTIGAQAVHDDDAGDGIGAGFGFQGCGVARSWRHGSVPDGGLHPPHLSMKTAFSPYQRGANSYR